MLMCGGALVRVRTNKKMYIKPRLILPISCFNGLISDLSHKVFVQSKIKIKQKKDTMAVADRLFEITRKDLEILKKLYAINGNAQNYVSYTTIDNYLRWFEKDSHLKHVKIYCFNGNFSDGTFVIIVS